MRIELRLSMGLRNAAETQKTKRYPRQYARSSSHKTPTRRISITPTRVTSHASATTRPRAVRSIINPPVARYPPGPSVARARNIPAPHAHRLAERNRPFDIASPRTRTLLLSIRRSNARRDHRPRAKSAGRARGASPSLHRARAGVGLSRRAARHRSARVHGG